MRIIVDTASTMWSNGEITHHLPRYYKVLHHGIPIQFPDGNVNMYPPEAWQSCPIGS